MIMGVKIKVSWSVMICRIDEDNAGDWRTMSNSHSAARDSGLVTIVELEYLDLAVLNLQHDVNLRITIRKADLTLTSSSD